jgi:anti-sigma regulatory factor (Ser/Thr protein kinase)
VEVNPPAAHRRVPIRAQSDVGEARRVATTFGTALGMDAIEAGKLALVVTEAAGNIHKHAGSGELLLRPIRAESSVAVEVIAIDGGGGMDVERCLADGYSTAGSPGTGLGAIARLSAVFEVYSSPAGSVLYARVDGQTSKPAASGAGSGSTSVATSELEVGAVCVALAGEELCGDAWTVLEQADRTLVMIADGLGHGPLAAAASEAAVAVLHRHPEQSLDQLLHSAHAALRPTRGAAMAIAEIERDGPRVRYCGAGNISGVLASTAASRSMVSQNGTVGMEMRRVQVFDYQWIDGCRLVMHSDGLTARWNLAAYPDLSGFSPSIVAAVLYRDFCRGRDDATVVVVQKRKASP